MYSFIFISYPKEVASSHCHDICSSVHNGCPSTKWQYKAVFAFYGVIVAFGSRQMPVMLQLSYLHCYEENSGPAQFAPC